MRRLSIAFLTTALLAGSATAETFKDWQVNCDASRQCRAIGLAAGDPDARGYLGIHRSFETSAPVELRFAVADPTGGLAGRPHVLLADGKSIASLARPITFSEPEEDGGLVEATLAVDETSNLLQALRQHHSLQLQAADGSLAVNVSLAGATAAWLYMEERLGRNALPAGPAT
ncbi:hypothetical protein C5L14_11480 [Labrys okinawensis]|uniref:DUF1176 domain-containing protein n=1 Tax=Labrys okinawensis TaxID=346911 RepID=A0A2S9QD67_9HYPH|nr:DUF1176 domain-containing protein [Labrys okinawensis]PRH87250.1 hypothetical protein C5L14_11480 [Labrys okinawensis]